MYKHISSKLQRAADMVISDPSKSFYTTVQNQKPPKMPSQSGGAPIPGFSGLTNCTINFIFNYGDKKD